MDKQKKKHVDVNKKKESLNTAVDWEKRAEEYLNGWKRAKADYLNLKKETETRQEEIVQFANSLFISELIPIIDNFTSAVTDAELHMDGKENEWLVGFSHIGKQFEDLLEKRGIQIIDTVGEAFNPELHEALEKQKDEKVKTGIIIKEIQRGYTLHGKVLRPAKVVVAE